MGLDPQSTAEIIKHMRNHCEQGNTVFFSSHNLDLVAKLCDRAAIINNGKLHCIIDLHEAGNKEALEENFLELPHVRRNNKKMSAIKTLLKMEIQNRFGKINLKDRKQLLKLLTTVIFRSRYFLLTLWGATIFLKCLRKPGLLMRRWLSFYGSICIFIDYEHQQHD